MRLKYIFLLAPFIFPALTYAALGGDVGDLQVENKTAKTNVTQTSGFSTHEFVQRKITIRQFAGSNGKVFAVAWHGKVHPDLNVLMGDHFDKFQRALSQAKKNHHGRSLIEIDLDGFHLEMGGHAMAVYGRTWLTQQIPVDVNTNALR